MEMNQLLQIWEELTPDEKTKVGTQVKSLQPSVKGALGMILWDTLLSRLVRVADNATILASWDYVVKEVNRETRRLLREGVGEELRFWTAVFIVYSQRFDYLFTEHMVDIQQAMMKAVNSYLVPSASFLLRLQHLRDTYSRRVTDYWFGSLSYDDQEGALRTLERGADLKFIDHLLMAIRESPGSEARAGTKIAMAILRLAERGELRVEDGVGQALRTLDEKYNDQRYYPRYTRYRRAKFLRVGLDPHQGLLADIVAEWAERKSAGEQKLSLKELAQRESVPVSELYHYQERQHYQRRKRQQ